jgi:hypothetical protein
MAVRQVCEYPQELGFRLDGEVELRQLQILAHQSKTPTRIEVYVSSMHDHPGGEVPPYHEARFRRLGFLTFHDNELNKYRNRERKTVQVRESVCYLKLILRKCYLNQFNLYNQVSIIQVLAFGEMLAPFQTRSIHGGGGANHLPPLRNERSQFNNHNNAAGGAGAPAAVPYADEEDVYSIIQPRSPSKHVVLPPLNHERRGGGRNHPQQQQQQQQRYDDPPSEPESPARRYEEHNQAIQPSRTRQQQHDTDDHAYHHQQQQHFQQPAAQPASTMNGLSHYRSQRILDFERFYVEMTAHLTARKSHAVDVEDFDAAKSCKDQLTFLQSHAEKIYDLENQKIRGIFDEDFDSAKRAKQQMDKLCTFARNSIEAAQAGRAGALIAAPPAGAAALSNSAEGDAPSAPTERRQGRQRQREVPAETEADEAPPYDPRPPPQDVENFDEQPVMSKYAMMMAEKAKLNKNAKGAQAADNGADDAEARDEEEEEAEEAAASDEEAAGDEEEHDEDSNDEDGKPKRGKQQDSKATAAPTPPSHSKGGKARPKRHSTSGNQDPDGDAAGEANSAPANPPPANYDEQPAAVTSTPNAAGAFDVESFAEWERDVYFAIQDEASKEGPTEAPAEPLEANEGMTDYISNFGQYTTACLFSKRWRLRDAAMRVVTQFLGTYYRHAIPVNAANAMIRYLDTKGHGLLDPILQAFMTACEFLTRLVEGRIQDVDLAAVQVHVQGLLPRLLLRACDTSNKSREEAIIVIFVLANSPIGPDRIAAAALADPVDQDKRRMNTQNHRTYMSRLLVMQQLMTSHGVDKTISVDALMNKLLLLCLNHQNNEVRDLAVAVTGCIDAAKGQEVMKYLSMVKNPATRSVIEDKLAFPADEDGAAAAPARTPSLPLWSARRNLPGPVRRSVAARPAVGAATSVGQRQRHRVNDLATCIVTSMQNLQHTHERLHRQRRQQAMPCCACKISHPRHLVKKNDGQAEAH